MNLRDPIVKNQSPSATTPVPGERDKDEATFAFGGFEIPERLALITGGGGSTFRASAESQLAILRRLADFKPDQSILEVGCGVGRLAIPLLPLLDSGGKYFGIDVVRDSIDWCQRNITLRYPNANFIHLDALSPMYNPTGSPGDLHIALPDCTVDLIVLYSVFTHLFEPDIRDYFQEFRRILKPNGKVLSTWFLIDDAALQNVREKGSVLGDLIRFKYRISMGCYVSLIEAPLGAVGYTKPSIEQMATECGFRISSVERGYWAGVYPGNGQSGQDAFVMELAE